jgi:pimeloyl-ACP methyl ester carboxylesterase
MVSIAPHTVLLHGQQLSYVDSGSGPVVLFIHGILGSQGHWAHLVDKMDDDNRVLVPDLFGHGESAKPLGDYSLSSHAATMRDLLDHLGVERVTLVGHSLGGGIAMQFYYLFPERVDRLVLVASGGLGREVNAILRSATLPLAEQVLSVAASAPVLSRVEALGRGIAKVGWRAGPDLSAVWQGFTQLGDRESRRAFLATTRAVIDLGGQTVSAHDHLESVPAIPTLVVWGSNDRMIPAWHALNAQRSVPHCRVELFQGAGHFPHLDDPDRFAAVLRDFIADDSAHGSADGSADGLADGSTEGLADGSAE